MSRHRLRVWIVAAVVIAFTAVSAIVFAEWLATGTGEGNAAAGTAVELRVEPADGIGVDSKRLVPGGTGDVEAVLYNDNPYDVEVREITQDGLITSDQSGCDGTSGEVTFTNQVGSWVVPADGQLSVQLADALAMGVDSANECQGAEFAVPLAVTGGSNVDGVAAPCVDDGYEPNDPSSMTELGEVFSGETLEPVVATRCPQNDDFYRVVAVESTSGEVCIPGNPERFTLRIGVSSGASGGPLILAVYDYLVFGIPHDQITIFPTSVSTAEVVWIGTCGISDSRDLMIRVTGNGGSNSTDQNTYEATISLTEENL